MGPYPCRQSSAYVCFRGRSTPRCGLQHAEHLGLLGRPAAAGSGGGRLLGRAAEEVVQQACDGIDMPAEALDLTVIEKIQKLC